MAASPTGFLLIVSLSLSLFLRGCSNAQSLKLTLLSPYLLPCRPPYPPAIRFRRRTFPIWRSIKDAHFSSIFFLGLKNRLLLFQISTGALDLPTSSAPFLTRRRFRRFAKSLPTKMRRLQLFSLEISMTCNNRGRDFPLLQAHIRVLEAAPENKAALLMGLEYLIGIPYVDDKFSRGREFPLCRSYVLHSYDQGKQF